MDSMMRIAAILLVCFSLAQCSSDDNDTDSSSLLVNGSEFRLGNNTSAITYNIIRSESDVSIRLNIIEKAINGRVISVFAVHETGSASGTYTLSNNMIASGVAVPALLNADGEQIAGGSAESQPMGTITLNDFGNNRYGVTFNEVVLDPDTASETTISGTCDKTFKFVAGN